jgi:phospholipid:diacylglycerol acyltransferase
VIGPDTSSVSSTPEPSSRDESPAKPLDNKIKTERHHGHHGKERRKRKSTFIFLLGSLFGIIAAGFLAKSNDLIEFPEIGELSMDNILDALPAGLVKDMKDLVVSNESSSDLCASVVSQAWPNRKGNGTSSIVTMRFP